MDDAALIRKTIRNCTAILVAAIGIAIMVPADEGLLGAIMTGAAVLYLAPTMLVGLGKRMDELELYEKTDEPGGSESEDI